MIGNEWKREHCMDLWYSIILTFVLNITFEIDKMNDIHIEMTEVYGENPACFIFAEL